MEMTDGTKYWVEKMLLDDIATTMMMEGLFLCLYLVLHNSSKTTLLFLFFLNQFECRKLLLVTVLLFV